MTKVAQATREVQRVLRLGLRVLLKRPKLRLELRRPEVGARNHTASKAKSAKRAAVPLPKKSAAAVAASAVLARMLKVRAKAKPSAARTALRRRGRLERSAEGTGEQGADGQPVEALHRAPQRQRDQQQGG